MSMTEQEWLSATDPNRMLEYLWTTPTNRKFRLFGAACCREGWNRLAHPSSRQAVEAIERFADNQITAEELLHARQCHRSSEEVRIQRNAANAISEASFVGHRNTAALQSAIGAAKYAAHAFTDKAEGGATSYKDPSWRPLWDTARNRQANLVRDIFNPFRPVSILPAWLTPAVLNLAQAAYVNRLLPSGLLDRSQLAVLADALEEAGCDKQDILTHLRGPGPHVRGCWLLDLLLNKE
jgi:hypothetical protein